MPKIDDIVWLRDNQIPELLNELAGTLLSNKPQNVYAFVAEWSERKHRLTNPSAPPLTSHTSQHTIAGAAANHNRSHPTLSRKSSAATLSGLGNDGFWTEPANVIPEGGGGGGFGFPPQLGNPYADESSDPGGAAGAPPAVPQRTTSSRRMSRAQSSGLNTPVEGAQGLPQQCVYPRPTGRELEARHPADNGRYELRHCIGEGHYGKVYEAVDAETKKLVAVKKITIDGDWVEQEIQHLRHCESERTVRLLQSHYCPAEDTLWLVMELLSVSVATMAESLGPRAFNEGHVACIAREVLRGLEVLHSLQRVHLDVKPGNLLFAHDRSVIKIADFGTMQRIGDDCIQLGDFAFMSPEVAYSQGKYKAGSDIWSFAITMLYLADGEAPLWREKPDLLMFLHRETCLRPSLWDPKMWSKEMSDVLFSCFMKDPVDRPSAAALLESEWLTQQGAGLDLSCLPLPVGMGQPPCAAKAEQFVDGHEEGVVV